MKKKLLYLPIKKKWFDMILSGEKKQEYREIKKYWTDRLFYFDNEEFKYMFIKFDYIILKNGYGKNSPTIKVKCKGILQSVGKHLRKKWGAESGKLYYVIKLGKIIERRNLK